MSEMSFSQLPVEGQMPDTKQKVPRRFMARGIQHLLSIPLRGAQVHSVLLPSLWVLASRVCDPRCTGCSDKFRDAMHILPKNKSQICRGAHHLPKKSQKHACNMKFLREREGDLILAFTQRSLVACLEPWAACTHQSPSRTRATIRGACSCDPRNCHCSCVVLDLHRSELLAMVLIGITGAQGSQSRHMLLHDHEACWRRCFRSHPWGNSRGGELLTGMALVGIYHTW